MVVGVVGPFDGQDGWNVRVQERNGCMAASKASGLGISKVYVLVKGVIVVE